MFVYFFNISFVTNSGDRLTNATVLSKVTTSPTFMLSSPELANVSIEFLTRAGVHSFRAFEEAAALRLVMVQTGPGNLSILSTRSACGFSCSSIRILKIKKNYHVEKRQTLFTKHFYISLIIFTARILTYIMHEAYKVYLIYFSALVLKVLNEVNCIFHVCLRNYTWNWAV